MAYPVTDADMSSSPSMRQLTTLRYMPNVALLPSKYHGDIAPASTLTRIRLSEIELPCASRNQRVELIPVYVVATPMVLLRRDVAFRRTQA